MTRSGYSLADYHIHPDFSFDATGSIGEYCEAANQKGLGEICFTTHYDTNPAIAEKNRRIKVNGQMLPATIDNLKPYVDAVSEAAEKYYPPIVRCGIEVGYYPGCEDEISRLFEKYPFYYKLCAIHEVDDIELCYMEQFEEKSKGIKLEVLADKYFKIVDKAATSGLFDTVAHIDIYKKYGLKLYGDDILTIHRGRIESVFNTMSKHEVGLEINTSALRKGHSEYYPSMDIVNMARKTGVRIMALGSDAHRPDEIGYDLEAAASIAPELFPYTDE
jgi:histidinol-phosphatase (PHP family)